MTRPRCICELHPVKECRFRRFRNPPLGWRIFLVAAFLAMPGFLAGGIVSRFLGGFLICSLAGALVGAILGAAMEATPSSVDDPFNKPWRASSEKPRMASVLAETR